MSHEVQGAVGAPAAGGSTRAVQQHPRGTDTESPAARPLAEEPLTAEQLAAEWDADKPPAGGPVANLLTGLVVLALGVLGVAVSLGIGVGTPAAPEGGLWPLAVSVVLTALGVTLVGLARRTSDTERFTGASWGVLGGLATMVAFVALIGRIGFEIPAVALALVWLKVLGGESWRVSVVGSVAIVAALYAVFVAALGVSIPHMF